MRWIGADTIAIDALITTITERDAFPNSFEEVMWRRRLRCFCQTLVGRFGLQAAEGPALLKRWGYLRSSGRTTAARVPVDRCS